MTGPADTAPAARNGFKAAAFYAALLLLGAFTALELVLFARSLFGGYLPFIAARFAWLALAAGLSIFCFRKFGAVRRAVGGDLGDLLLIGAWVAFAVGGIGGRFFYRSPAATLMDELESDRQACDLHARAVLIPGPASDSHEKGSGYIVLRATFTARVPLVVQEGGYWVPMSGQRAVFLAQLARTELKPGVPSELVFHLVASPELDANPPLRDDGPYLLPDIQMSVYDPARTEHWATWAGESSCRTAVIRNYRTAAYKAADFGREKWRFESAWTFGAGTPKAPGKKAK